MDKKYENKMEDDKVVYVPMEIIRNFENIYNMVKETQKEFYKVAEAMKPIKN